MEIIKEIEYGSFGEVVVDGERRSAKTSVFEDGIKKEIEQLSRVNHINIVTVFGLQLHENVPYLIMEFTDGGSMKDLLRSRHINLTDMINWFSQVAAGLAFLHAKRPQPMLHRDINPHNILLSMQIAKIGNFDWSRDLDSTMTNNIGTSLYMAPEVFASEKYTEKCDVHSFGISLWEMLARKRPFAEYEIAEQIKFAAYYGQRPSFNGLRCHNILIDLIRFCWHKDPTKRPSMQKVVKVLRHTLKLYEQFDLSTDLLAGKVVGHSDEKLVQSAEHQVRDFMFNIQRKRENTEMVWNSFDEWNWDYRRKTDPPEFFFGIVDDNKYNGEIPEDQWTSVEEAVADMGLKLQYFRAKLGLLRNSIILVSFENERSLELYKNAIAEIGEVYPGAQLRVIDAEDLRLGTEATALLPNKPSDPEAILNMLGEFNPHVAINNWKVLEIEECSQSQIQVIFQLPNDWEDENVILNYGLNTVRLNVIQFNYWLKYICE